MEQGPSSLMKLEKGKKSFPIELLREIFKLGVGEGILALNSLNVNVMDGGNLQQISDILDEMWNVADFCAVQLAPLSQTFSISFTALTATWNASNGAQMQNGGGEDAVTRLRTRITTKITTLVNVFFNIIDVGNGFLGSLNQHFLQRALERIQQKTNMLGQFINNEANVEEVENNENVPP
uniref:Uncharacterized protein n=1 Tax=Meloidogyne javanica TaxID=6303 RepID=A0A915MCB9_MELJA